MSVTGIPIFANPADPGDARVDRFHACRLGAAAHEIRDKDEAADAWVAVWTRALVAALKGDDPQVVEEDGPERIVRPWPLHRRLGPLVVAQLRDLGKLLTVAQEPDSRITSDPTQALLSVLPTSARVPKKRRGRPADAPASPTVEDIGRGLLELLDDDAPPDDPSARWRGLVTRPSLPPPRSRGPSRRPAPRRSKGGLPRTMAADTASEVGRFATLLSEPFGPDHLESERGFKLRGAVAVAGVARDARVELLALDDEGGDGRRPAAGQLVRVWADGDDAVEVVLRLGTATSVVAVPAPRGWIGALTVEDDKLVDVAWEPMPGSEAWQRFSTTAGTVRALHAALGAATRHGALAPGPDEAASLTSRVLGHVAGDPSLALLAAPVLDELGRHDDARLLADAARDAMGASFLDLDVLDDDVRRSDHAPAVAPANTVPLLARTWPLVDGAVLDRLRPLRRDAPWTTFRGDAFATVAELVIGTDERTPPRRGTASELPRRPPRPGRGGQPSRTKETHVRTQLVLVHGRSQEDKNAVDLKAEWRDTLHRGLVAAEIDGSIDDADIRFPYYGDTLRDLAFGDPERAADVIVRGGVTPDAAERAFLEAVVEEMLDVHDVRAEQVRQLTEDPDVVEKAPPGWGAVLAGLRALERFVPGASETAVATITRDVHAYLGNPGVRDVIEAGVRDALSADVANVVVAHSLGSIVVYNLLRREAEQAGWRVPLLVTVGSPLGIKAVRDRLRPLTGLTTVGDWVNARDPRDVVALRQLDQDHFPIDSPYVERIDEVDNQTGNHHGITGYLDDPIVARRVHRAMTS